MFIDKICTNRSCAWKRACVRHKLRGAYLIPEVKESLGGNTVVRNCTTYKLGKEEDEASWVAPTPVFYTGPAHRCCS